MTRKPPDALLLLATGCAHCAGVLAGLAELLKQGRIGRLEAVNIAEHPEIAHTVGAGAIPWIRIGSFELEGAMTPAELARWVDLAGTGNGIGAYYSHLLEIRRPHQVRRFVEERPSSLSQLIGLLADDETSISVRIGIGVVLEELEGNPILAVGLEALISLARSPQANTRADAAYYLGLTHTPSAEPALRELLADPNQDVREIAGEALQRLAGAE
jgi:hypothetical protein